MRIEQLHSHLAVTLEEGEKLSELGLKTIQTRPISNCIVPGMVTLNGGTRLVYPTDDYSSVEVLFSRMTDAGARKILKDLAKALDAIEDTAFLAGDYIVLSTKYVYVNQEDENTGFVLVPSERKDNAADEMETKVFIKSILGKCNPSNLALQEIVRNLPGILDEESNAFKELSVEDVLHNIHKVFIADLDNNEVRETRSQVARQNIIEEVELRYRGVHGAFAFFDRKNEFLIGKDPGCDGVVTVNPAVSRKHLRIIKTVSECYVEDMGSKNGTVLNNMLLTPGLRLPLKNGDKLMVADMQFDVIVHIS